MVLPVAIPFERAYLVNLSAPLTCSSVSSLMMKFEANAEAVILWQSVQLQMKESTRLSPSMDCGDGRMSVLQYVNLSLYVTLSFYRKGR